MVVKEFTTSVKQTKVVIELESNGSYTAYETNYKGKNVKILNSWSLDWLIDTLHMRYMSEKLIEVQGA